MTAQGSDSYTKYICGWLCLNNKLKAHETVCVCVCKTIYWIENSVSWEVKNYNIYVERLSSFLKYVYRTIKYSFKMTDITLFYEQGSVMLGYRLKGEYLKSSFAPCNTHSTKQIILTVWRRYMYRINFHCLSGFRLGKLAECIGHKGIHIVSWRVAGFCSFERTQQPKPLLGKLSSI